MKCTTYTGVTMENVEKPTLEEMRKIIENANGIVSPEANEQGYVLYHLSKMMLEHLIKAEEYEYFKKMHELR